MIISIENEAKRYESPEDVEELISLIDENASEIVEINLQGNVFTPEALEPLFQKISELKDLKVINLSRIFSALPNKVMLKGLSIICKYLDPTPLILLDLSDNAISCEFPEEFTSFLCGLKNLEVLKMSNCGLGTIGGNKLADCLSKIENKNNLLLIDISMNKLIQSAIRLGHVLEQFVSLAEIRMQYNTVDRDSMDAFLRSFREHSLRVLDIRDNFLSLEGCRLLGEYFLSWDIEELRLGDCMMGNEGILEFIKQASEKRPQFYMPGGFSHTQEKFNLDLSYNEMEESGLKALVKFVKNREIGCLWLEGNDFDEDGENFKELKIIIESKGGSIKSDEKPELNEKEEVDGSLLERFEAVLQ
ncbi:Ran GTPase-activating protein [Astathelohania contejeani]|uniref:Ran GTPase-activating protein n=1 Tax=Astathelohania contejeani TaxID=164912 RepID=A0ABQ7HZP8_9MICR|nr:Ran GTPase-activating protein [Thelohania contejeani]